METIPKRIKNLNNDIKKYEEEIEKYEEDIEDCEYCYTKSEMQDSRFYNMYNMFINFFPQIYDAFLANRQNINAYGYKKEKRKKTVTKRKNKTKKRHRK